jgi:hypothetical protein
VRRLLVVADGAGLLLVEAGAGGDLAELVVEGALLLVAEHVEGGGDVLELLLRLLVARVDVRVVLLGELAVGLLDLVVAGRLGDAERCVEVFGGVVGHRGANVSTGCVPVKRTRARKTPATSATLVR